MKFEVMLFCNALVKTKKQINKTFVADFVEFVAPVELRLEVLQPHFSWLDIMSSFFFCQIKGEPAVSVI